MTAMVAATQADTMTLPLLGTLAALALVDSTSFGTLLIPIWLMLTPGRLRPGRILVFLAVVALFYFGMGLLLLAGADSLMAALEQDSPVLMYGQLVLGAALFAGAFFVGREPKNAVVPQRNGQSWADGASASASASASADGVVGTAPPVTGRLARWRERTLTAEGRGGWLALIGLALGAATLEVATMLPYLGAVGMLTAADLTATERVLLLTGYCLVMVLPALVLLGGRIAARRMMEPLLTRVSTWMAKSSGETIGWVMGIAGFLLLRDAATRIGLLEQFGISLS
ncbi:GAP family protein [Ruania halotolerans]|uniref:GAP family protein n=1 Tax=Ruania halotolerans TaxID=2897773 RepID=UPI001E3CD239|nr:GAP family protein [Ruania halotolerans]UFU06868.1 GAP family protein [Ruania halotolerans]